MYHSSMKASVRFTLLGLFLIVLSVLSISLGGCAHRITILPENSETLANWQLARNYQAEHRLELSRQYYLLALASSRSPESQTSLKREIEAVDRMIQSMR